MSDPARPTDDLGTIYEEHGATFAERGGREIVARYHRPERTHRAVRDGVGAIEMACGVLEITGEDRIEFDSPFNLPAALKFGDRLYSLEEKGIPIQFVLFLLTFIVKRLKSMPTSSVKVAPRGVGGLPLRPLTRQAKTRRSRSSP